MEWEATEVAFLGVFLRNIIYLEYFKWRKAAFAMLLISSSLWL